MNKILLVANAGHVLTRSLSQKVSLGQLPMVVQLASSGAISLQLH